MEARLNGELAQMTRAAAGATPKLQRASDLANDITRLQNRFSTVDEQLQNQILEDSAPGTAHLAVAAVAPQHPAVSGVVRNALVLFLGFVFLGLAAAVIAQKMDPRIYIAVTWSNCWALRPWRSCRTLSRFPTKWRTSICCGWRRGSSMPAKKAA